MAPETAQPVLRRRQRRRPRIFVLLFLVGGLTLLSLCLFTYELSSLRSFTSLAPFRTSESAMNPEAGMTSAENAPHQDSQPNSNPNDDSAEQPATVIDVPSSDSEEKKPLKTPMEPETKNHPHLKNPPPHIVVDLPREHIPTYTPSAPTDEPGSGENRTGGKRLVVVGDVHGHLSALEALLNKVNFNVRNGDHLILAGDMVTKGPDSVGVVKLAMALGASAVRGNQEDKVLAAIKENHRMLPQDKVKMYANEDGQVDEEKKRKDEYRHIARHLSSAQAGWIRDLPIILRIGQLPDAINPPWNAETITVIHGGLVPGVPLEKQSPWAVMNMRSLVYPGHRKGKGKGKNKHPWGVSEQQEEEGDDEEIEKDAVAVPIEGRDGEPWSHAWNRHQNRLPPNTLHTLAIYGHDAKAGLQVNPKVDISPWPAKFSASSSTDGTVDIDIDTNKKHKHKKKTGLRYAFGLDSGCGHEKQLTALVVEAGPDGVVHRVVQVDCSSSSPVLKSQGDGHDHGHKGVEAEVGVGQKVIDDYEDGGGGRRDELKKETASRTVQEGATATREGY